jgi:hypothetical protein
LIVITGDFFLSDPQISEEDKDWLYPQMIQAIKKVKDSIILVFSPTKLSTFSKVWIIDMKRQIAKLYVKYSEPEYITGPSGVIPIAVLKYESNTR